MDRSGNGEGVPVVLLFAWLVMAVVAVDMHKTIRWKGDRLVKKEMRLCAICKTWRSIKELNIEGNIHHGCSVKCHDSIQCERRKRKGKKP